jgi:hypothetical protein
MGKFFPKPGDIWERIENIRGAITEQREPVHRSEIEQEQESPEWQKASLRARLTLAKMAEGVFNPKRNTRKQLKQQAAELMKKRESKRAAAPSQNSSTGQ